MRTSLLALAVAVTAMPVAGDTLADFAAAGEWSRVLEVATLRREQLPLRPDEALLAAHAARRLGAVDAERRFLELAQAGGPLAAVAAVELAELVAEQHPGAAVSAALPVMISPPTPQLGEAAVEALALAYAGELDDRDRDRVRGALRRVPAGRARALAAVVGRIDGDPARLAAVLAGSTRDLAALTAAESLADSTGLAAVDRWRIAETLYRHARYDDAAARLEALATVSDRAVPVRQVAFLRGRCAFRRGHWEDAEAWYQRALGQTRAAEERADLLVHIARARELGGDLDGAVELARQAVLIRASDDRRLFLARLRLRRGEPDLAALGVSRARSHGSRDRGALLIALDELRRGDSAAARTRLDTISRSPWAGPAMVLAAGIALAADRAEAALSVLERDPRHLDGYWGQQARALVARMPLPAVTAWRERLAREVVAGDGAAARRAIATWALLEPDRDQLERVRPLATAMSRFASSPSPSPPLGLAGALWRAGLADSAVRWDPRSLPGRTADDALWSAGELVRHGAPWDAIRLADHAWRLGGDELPLRVHPPALTAALLPLPDPAAVRVAADAAGVPWPLVAAVAREESRWRPDAVSAVGARGLMQLMPATAAALAARLGIAVTPDDLFDPAVNLRLGATELARLVATFDGHRAAAVAAYNAGEDQARLWLAQCGGCDEQQYVAGISFAATRVYTADVLASASAYGELFDAPAASGSTAAPSSVR